MEKLKDYLITQLDKMTAWIGVIGLFLLFLGLHSALTFLFIMLVILPEAQFSDVFKGWTKQLRDLDAKK